jgi:hypothetical protein
MQVGCCGDKSIPLAGEEPQLSGPLSPGRVFIHFFSKPNIKTKLSKCSASAGTGYDWWYPQSVLNRIVVYRYSLYLSKHSNYTLIRKFKNNLIYSTKCRAVKQVLQFQRQCLSQVHRSRPLEGSSLSTLLSIGQRQPCDHTLPHPQLSSH